MPVGMDGARCFCVGGKRAGQKEPKNEAEAVGVWRSGEYPQKRLNDCPGV